MTASSNSSTTFHLANQIDEFFSWKQGLQVQISEYCAWLNNTSMASDDLVLRLSRAINALQRDELTIAFVGEFSRGKTELINALLQLDTKQRLLPSKAGRTTMCPTELFYDRDTKSNYIRLLPIESRRLNLSIQDMKAKQSLWQSYEFNLDEPESMASTLQRVTELCSVDCSEAKALGFDEAMLEQDPLNEGKVFIPKWRHAELSVEHPFLKQGLRILDTPGLNALGSEPELTVSMIPNAQAVVFMLSADAGVTASDLSVWKDYIQEAFPNSAHEHSCFAVLNKVDVLWDDPQGDTYTAAAIERVKQDTAQRLSLPMEAVVAVSAKQALLGKVRGDQAQVNRSGISKLESVLLERSVALREEALYETTIADISALVDSSKKVVSHRIQRLESDLNAHQESIAEEGALAELADKTQQDHAEFYQKLVALRSSRRLMMSQKEILLALVNPEVLNELLANVKEQMQHAWSTRAMARAMQGFFDQLDAMFDGLMLEARVAEKMVDMMYTRFKSDHQASHLHPISFSIKKERQALADLKHSFKKYRRHPKLLITEQTLVIKHFFNAFVRDAKQIHQSVYMYASNWSDEALLPLLQYTVEQKQGLQDQLEGLQNLAKAHRSKRDECVAMERMIEDLNQQLALTQKIAVQLQARPSRPHTA